MAHPILSFESAISSPDSQTKATPNLLPCRVHHDGPIGSVETYWEPKQGEDGSSTAFFRGRKLVGKTVKLPEGYRGVVAAKADKSSPVARPDDELNQVGDLEGEGEGEGESGPEQGSMQVQAEFDEMVIWGHEATVDNAEDPYTRGMEEMLSLADLVRQLSVSLYLSGLKC
ncbi:ribonuclease H2 non-catalytic subunit-domain-containing protein [Bombardia bombarda]|uniref:Ribonuclease H2 non-catalytic subunit-domain-containing protein n=1 Tax=Bombardia bombarda TaxID=252184 RepID=A0AA40CG07_9PEZI|nr:ribonuclease H2 non-catalytic subunit-domain-containing protein [Bombardia bombarda]